MLFDTFAFAAFYAVVALACFLAPARLRWAVLLGASYFFYAWWSLPYLAVILAITLVDYLAALAIEASAGWARQGFLGLSLAANLGLLFLFKYFDFFRGMAGLHWPVLHLALPLGLSFHTLQAIGYTVDVYCGRVRAERHPGYYALFVAFFPQLIAGPIERAGRLLPQFHAMREPGPADIEAGAQLILRGLVKKTVFADMAAPFVDDVYRHPTAFSSPMLALGTLLFAVEIYCDFSGYSDMAVGIARTLGFELTTNFRSPWQARTVADFWRRWHLSLSQWFRDYVYISLGGSRVSAWRWGLNVMLVFALSGLWHGASARFVAWGALHGAYLVCGRATARLRERLWRLVGFPVDSQLRVACGLVWTNLVVGASWILFRAGSLHDAAYIWLHLWEKWQFRAAEPWNTSLPRFETALILIALGAMAGGWLLRGGVAGRPAYRIAWLAAEVYAVVFFGVFRQLEFIYFQF